MHSYNELKSCIEGLIDTDMYYINLGNDIDCNDYGEDFVWHSVGVNNNTRPYTLDLCNHTIKNIIIATGESMFTFPGAGGVYIKNGKILNVFMTSSIGFNKYFGGIYSTARVKNVSISTNITGLNAGANAFYTGFENCAIYLEGSTSSTAGIFKVEPSTETPIKNTDIMLNDVRSGGYLFSGLRPISPITDCRVRGKFTSNASNAAWNDGANACIINSVFDVEVNKTHLVTNSGVNTGVINSDKIPSGYDTRGLTAVTSEEIINGAALRAKGFSVVNVVS